MRNMSFALTTAQVRARRKWVTRRTGWRFAKPGMRVWAVEKCQGLKRGGHVVRITPIEFTVVRFEPLRRLIDDIEYGFEELRLEGFDFRDPIPGIDAYWYYPVSFVEMFCATHTVPAGEFDPFRNRVPMRRCTPDDEVTRIEFEYVGDEARP